MNKRNVFAFVIAIVITGTSFANSDSTKIFKNEIGTNLAPILAVAIGGSPGYANKFSFVYRRNLNTRLSLRVSPSITLFTTPWYYYNNFSVISTSDSTETRSYNHYENSPKFQMNIGMEYNWGKKKVKWFTGADLFYSYKSYSSREDWETFKWDTLGGYYNLYSVNDTAGIYPEYSFSSSSSVHSVGFSPFIGIKIPLTKHFALTAQASYDFSFGYGKTSEQQNGGWLREYYFSVFEIDSPGLISDVSLAYKF